MLAYCICGISPKLVERHGRNIFPMFRSLRFETFNGTCK